MICLMVVFRLAQITSIRDTPCRILLPLCKEYSGLYSQLLVKGSSLESYDALGCVRWAGPLWRNHGSAPVYILNMGLICLVGSGHHCFDSFAL